MLFKCQTKQSHCFSLSVELHPKCHDTSRLMWFVSVEGSKERAVCGEVERMWKETVGTRLKVETCEIRRNAWLRPKFRQVISGAIVAGLAAFGARVARVMRI